MVIDDEVRQAIEFESDMKQPVLTVYLNVDPHRRSVDKYKLALRNLLGKVAPHGARNEKVTPHGARNEGDTADPADLQRITNYVEMGYNRQGRGLVMFSCAARDFWWAKSFNVPVEDAVYLSRRPNVRQLAALMDTYARYGVIHIDQEGARLYVFNMGNLEAVEGYLGEEVKQHRAGGWASPRYQRHEAEAARRNLQDAAELAESFYRRNNTRRLLLAGTEKNVARFQELLSHRLRSIVVGRFPANANATPSSLRERALELALKAANEEAEATVDRIVTAVHKEGPAVAGLAETLTAVQNGQAMHVVALSNFSQPAYRFVDSGYIVMSLDDAQEFGSGKVQELPDAVESVLRRSMAQGIGVTIVDQHKGLEKIGKIAALTRY